MIYTAKEKAAGMLDTSEAALEITHTQFSAKSPHSEAQRQRIIEALRRCPQTSYDLRCLGIYQAPARVKELRDRLGYDIITARVTLFDRDGYAHPRAALYSLVGEPNGERP